MKAIALPPWLAGLRVSSEAALVLGIVLVLVILIVPLPGPLLDAASALNITVSVLMLMVTLLLARPLDFQSFPQLLLITTLFRLGLNVGTTRAILASGHEGPEAAGAVIATFGRYLMGGDILVGLIVFAILLLVNHVVVSKGAGRVAEVAARFHLDAMPGKQMAIDADLNAGTIDENQARERRRELQEESGFHGAMDGAAKFVKGDAIAGLVSTFINLLGGLAIGVGRHGMGFMDAVETYSILTVGDGLVGQIPALLVSVAAAIIVTKAAREEQADQLMARELAGWKPLAIASAASLFLGLMPGMPLVPFVVAAGATGAAAWFQRKASLVPPPEPDTPPPVPTEPAVSEALRMDLLRLELGYGLLSLASGDAPRLTEQIRGLRRSIAQEMGFVLPSVRIQDNLDLPPDTYILRVKEIEAARGVLRPPLHLAINPEGGTPDMPGEKTSEPAFGLPALWIEEKLRDEALMRGCTVVDCAGVLATHLTEVVRENMSELLSYAETQKLLDELPKEQQKLVSDLIPTQVSVGVLQRLLQALLAERVSIRDLPTILEGLQEAATANLRAIPQMLGIVRMRLARQLSESARGPQGYVPLVTLSPEWEVAFAECLSGPLEDRQLVMDPGRLQAFMQRLRDVLDAQAAQGEHAILLCSGALRPHLRAIVERFRPSTSVLSQSEIHPRARIRTLGSV
ncbi:flagellar biosynthesis protein FlhA [Roseococcus sp. SYP-B2431]|uniref:flagellar biosynthesis protein FlhA n=1 Tax=Roseococcus sp. SYP-B2431 TaxID=2496640 RepID=UPI00103FB0E6|nr:flagellar biosynthesis protein FlhA [Roseococcus sp. SYP-B2431]TCH98659.1 flagellar biosynthesis protein FlhA [Roseococcus sp. SYP-B2431]